MKNRFITAALAMALSAAMVVPASASTIVSVNKNQSVTSNGGNRVSGGVTQSGVTEAGNGKTFTAPGWLWVGPYCYYFEGRTIYEYASSSAKEKTAYNSAALFKNGTTPDGYQVDAEGRWIVDGVVQINPEFGNVKLGMASDYDGKSGNDLWVAMRENLKSVWKEMYPHTGFHAFRQSTDTFIEGNAAGRNTGASGAYFTAMYDVNDNTINIIIPNEWYHHAWAINGSQDLAAYANRATDIEKTLKAALGDTAGQELFNYMRSVADGNVSESFKLVYDESGNAVYDRILKKQDGTAWEVDESGNIIKARPELNGGVNSRDRYIQVPKTEKVIAGESAGFEKLDWSGWQNRTTDYGKKFSVTENGRVIVIYL